jgi:hypothetical protein
VHSAFKLASSQYPLHRGQKKNLHSEISFQTSHILKKHFMETLTSIWKPLSIIILIIAHHQALGQEPALPSELFKANKDAQTRWSSFENIKAERGKGGIENNSAKGRPYRPVEAGESVVLLDEKGPGIINRMWITVHDRSPEMLRSLKIEMFWDGERRPAVSVPFGDFFGVGLGRMTPHHNALFSQPEGRSFNCYIPMPFKKSAKIVVTNESKKRLSNLFFDINFQLLKEWSNDNLYFHAYFNRDTATKLAEDFTVLPNVKGTGRFLGANIGVNANPLYKTSWWGEGEVKIYLDGDKRYPTLAGTGTEDYIGTGWGQGRFINTYQGCTIADDSNMQWTFYRYHVPDPVYFKENCRVTLQQIGGEMKAFVAQLQKARVPLIPVTIDDGKEFHHYYKRNSVLSLDQPGLPDGWTNFYRSDDVSSVAYFYLDEPSSSLPSLQPLEIRTANLRSKTNGK